MPEFTAITSQEQLDNIIGERLKRSEEKWKTKYTNYSSPDDVNAIKGDYEKQINDLTSALEGANKKLANHDKELAERDTKIRAYETRSVKNRIAHESGLSYEAIEFLKGETEEEIKQSADTLKALMGTHRSAPEFIPTEPVENGNTAFRNLAKNLSK